MSLKIPKREDDAQDNRHSQKRTLHITAEQRKATHAVVERLRRFFCSGDMAEGGQEQDDEATWRAFWVGGGNDPSSDDRQRVGHLRSVPEQRDGPRDIVEVLRRCRGIGSDKEAERNDDNRSL